MGDGLRGKVALVTGASQGIGFGCAQALADDGACVVITGRREDALAKACDAIREKAPHARVEMFAGDATDEDSVKRALAFTHGLEGKLDIIASVVGDPTFRPLLMRELDQVRREFDLNFISAYLAVRHGAPLMERGGSIVCMSSTGASQASWGLTIYAACKAAVERFVRAAAFELGGAGIRVNAVRPGLTLTEEREQSLEFRQIVEDFTAETPLGRIGRPEDIARVVRFLAGPESGWVTGQTFSADGGLDQGKGTDPMDAIYGKEVMDRIRAGKEA